MFHLNKWFYLLTLLLVVCSSMVVAFDFSLCETPELALAELGDDYYAFCERNIAPDYYSDTPELALQQQIIPPKTAAIIFEESLLLDEDQSFFTKNGVFIGASSGFLLLVFFLSLIIFHHYHRSKAKKDSRQQLLVLIQQYLVAGYTLEHIRQLLLERGYDDAFINELFVTLETSP